MKLVIEEFKNSKEMMEHYTRSPYNNFQLTRRQELRIYWTSFLISLKIIPCLIFGHRVKYIPGDDSIVGGDFLICTRCRTINPEGRD